jgi:hypothetical protein
VDQRAEQRFWSKVDTSAGVDGCWPWLGSATASVWFDGRRRRAHRIAYEQSTGEQLGSRVVVARCRDPLCVNPGHLAAATKGQVQNRRDRANRNNRNSGVRNVYRDKKRWSAAVWVDGKSIRVGTFDTVAEADAAVRKARARIF